MILYLEIPTKNSQKKFFYLNIRNKICEIIFDIYEEHRVQIPPEKVVNDLIEKLREQDILLLNWLIEKKPFDKALHRYYLNLVILIFQLKSVEKINISELSRDPKIQLNEQIITSIILHLKESKNLI